MSGNNMQQVFDVLASVKRPISIHALRGILRLAPSSIRSALDALKAKALVESVPIATKTLYRVIAGAERPEDGRGRRRREKEGGGTPVAD